MNESDRIGFDDPQNVADCAQAIYMNMRKQEEANMVNPSYL